jgi:mutator protein MutT
MKKTVLSTGGAIIRGKKILICRRADTEKRFPGYWSFAGGKIDGDEAPEQAVTREIKEEIGIRFQPEEKLGEYKTELEDIFVVQHIFIGPAEGEPMTSSEVSECRWFTYEETKDLEFAFSYKKVIDDLHKKGLI